MANRLLPDANHVIFLLRFFSFAEVCRGVCKVCLSTGDMSKRRKWCQCCAAGAEVAPLRSALLCFRINGWMDVVRMDVEGDEIGHWTVAATNPGDRTGQHVRYGHIGTHRHTDTPVPTHWHTGHHVCQDVAFWFHSCSSWSRKCRPTRLHLLW